MNAITSFRLCKLSTHELVIKVDKQTDRMFETQRLPTRNVPAEPNEDYDLLIGELILRFGELEAFINSVEADLSDMMNNDGIGVKAVNLRRKVSMFLAAQYGKQVV
jgi:hypothetical protein